MVSRKVKAAIAAAGAAALALAITAALRPGSRDTHPDPPPHPESAAVHDSTQDPQDVERHWTPERVREAQENMRHATGHDD